MAGNENRAALISTFEKAFHDWDKRQLDVFLVSDSCIAT